MNDLDHSGKITGCETEQAFQTDDGVERDSALAEPDQGKVLSIDIPSLAALDARLHELHARTAETPVFNPVFQLGLELSRRIENGELALDRVEVMVAELEREGLQVRARRLHRLIAPLDPQGNLGRIRGLAETGDFAAFAGRWSRPLAHIVFTAHPTFLLSRAQGRAVAAAASTGDFSAEALASAWPARDTITLDTEHSDAMAAIARGQAARDAINGVLFAVARQRWPSRWRDLKPLPLRFASWVGYDMDGRTDIGWATCIRYRLAEKAERLAAYAAMLHGCAPDLAARLASAGAYASTMANRFGQPATVKGRSNLLAMCRWKRKSHRAIVVPGGGGLWHFVPRCRTGLDANFLQ